MNQLLGEKGQTAAHRLAPLLTPKSVALVGASPKPGFELKDTGDRYEILLHPGHRYLSSIGCINPCTSLPDANEEISYAGSRRRVISLIEDMKAYVGSDFPRRNGKIIPRAFIVIDGEP